MTGLSPRFFVRPDPRAGTSYAFDLDEEGESEKSNMIVTMERLLDAREATRELLEELELKNYRFDVEPRDDAYEIIIEMEYAGAWREKRLTETAAALLSTQADAASRQRLAARWRARLVPERTA